jgi:hypothetical protein
VSEVALANPEALTKYELVEEQLARPVFLKVVRSGSLWRMESRSILLVLHLMTGRTSVVTFNATFSILIYLGKTP